MSLVLYESSDRIAVIRINRPARAQAPGAGGAIAVAGTSRRIECF